jgi:hypothetical protein
MTNPMAKRSRNAAVIAARLSGKDMGSIVATAMAPKAAPRAYTVAREMGHGGESMVRRVYGHLGQVRHRSESVEYRVEQHVAKLGTVGGAPCTRFWHHHWHHGVDLSTDAVTRYSTTSPP